ncbi:MAG: hypothetical protein JWO50_543 [Candidatus Kaiserbacteria bacterium]|nr:hypothetical protein [Candidatus Kaiserbacteria bacterium]
MNKRQIIGLVGLTFLPSIALAQTVAVFAGLVNICIGVFFTISFVMFTGGTLEYLFHLGMPHREHGLEKMHWGVVILVVVLFLVGISRFLQHFFV